MLLLCAEEPEIDFLAEPYRGGMRMAGGVTAALPCDVEYAGKAD